MLLITLFIRYIPTFIAFKKNKHNKFIVLIVNILLGWNILGWLAALYLALKKDKRNMLAENKYNA
ncbi:superinfection immunity protein [Bacillus lacus]|uniref:Superinfection immunity protein n=2 Tax=Metabacillus lacus TaxID=1983721 RepID=A0A7X2IWH0_9BACI|nr:superinfection immunity protein [Metabacillus lacus]MRX71088.1 superinfection immunity protein [Metabacillus lacus]